MNHPTTVRLSDDQIIWINEMNLNVSKYVRSLIDKDMATWKEISDKVLQPIVNAEKLDESHYQEVQNEHQQIDESAFKEIKN
jgi:hypothetical protein